MSDTFNVNYNVGGKIDRVRHVDLIKKITYPEQLIPELANDVKTKGFRLECPDATPISFSFIAPISGPVWLSELSVTPEANDDLDYWELEVNGDKVFETMYTQEVSDGGVIVGSFDIYKRVEQGEEIVFTFYNDSGNAKKVWITLGYIFQKI